MEQNIMNCSSFTIKMSCSSCTMLLLACFLFLCCCPVLSKEVFISDNGVNSFQCLRGVSPCRSLEYVATASNISNIVIRINCTCYTLDGVAQFTGVDNITITGQDQNTTIITCSNTTNGGLAFVNSSNIHLQNFSITHCGLLIEHSSHLLDNVTAILIQDSHQVVISNITFANNNGRGLSLINSYEAQVSHSQFINNTIVSDKDTRVGGGGLLVVFLAKEWISNNTIIVLNNTFVHNIARMIPNSAHKSDYGGGGIKINITNASHLCIKVIGNNISRNCVVNGSGGGLELLLNGNSNYNNITLTQNNFTDNSASKSGGGAKVTYYTYKSQSHNNIVQFNSTMFESNNAGYSGGAVAIAATIHVTANETYNGFHASNCHFESNTAKQGSAVDVRPAYVGHFGKQFHVCVYIRDCVFAKQTRGKIQLTSTYRKAVFVTTGIPINFGGYTRFDNSSSTALYIVSTQLWFQNNSETVFSHNRGYKGGAIYLMGDSKIRINSNNTLRFHKNKACYGGAIGVDSEQIQIFLSSEYCFIKLYTKSSHLNKNITFAFSGNHATLVGNDIYVTTIKPCLALCRKRNMTLKTNDLFSNNSCLGDFNFGTYKFRLKDHVATAPQTIKLNSELKKLVPGWSHSMQIVVRDEFGGNVTSAFPLSVRAEHNNTFPKLLGNRMITINGLQESQGQLIFETQNKQLITNFTLTVCPPGFVFNFTTSSCTCGHFHEIGCHNGVETFEATLHIGFWTGYVNNRRTIENKLLTGICSTQLCRRNRSLKLPLSPHELNNVVCRNHSEGRLCGKCQQNYSLKYYGLECTHSETCQFGILRYIFSNIVPVTFIFLVILIFNISLTSGAVNSLVFFVQIAQALDISAFGTINYKNHILKFLVRNFKLSLSVFGDYCVIPTKSAMTVLMMYYATILYAFLLVVGTILVLRVYSCYSCVKMCRRCGRRNIRGSIVDGLSAFIVLYYSLCAITTEQVLSPSYIQEHYMDNSTIIVCLYDGELKYLEGQHLWYAVPAFLCIIFILIPPPLVLLLEPLLTKLFSLDYFTGTIIKWLYNRLRLKLMPFLDSFQSCFKDKYRCFAGIYLLYRVLVMILLKNHSMKKLYGQAAIFFGFVLFIHILFQPNKNKWHNILEQSLFLDLIIVNGLTAHNYARQGGITYNSDNIVIIQLVLLSVPILYFIIYILFNAYKKVSSSNIWCCKKVNKCCKYNVRREDVSFSEIPARLHPNISFNYDTF